MTEMSLNTAPGNPEETRRLFPPRFLCLVREITAERRDTDALWPSRGDVSWEELGVAWDRARAILGDYPTNRERRMASDVIRLVEYAVCNGFSVAFGDPFASAAPDGEPRDWLVLSVKWSKGSEDLVWFKPNASGYTTDLNQAGRYTKEEARRRHDLETHGNNAAVPLVTALAASRTYRTVEARLAVVDDLVRAGEERMARP